MNHKLLLPNHELLVPVSALTQVALDSVETVLLAADSTPESLEPLEVHFYEAIIGSVGALERLDDVAMYRLSQIASVRRPAKLWDIVDDLIRRDNHLRQPEHCQGRR